MKLARFLHPQDPTHALAAVIATGFLTTLPAAAQDGPAFQLIGPGRLTGLSRDGTVASAMVIHGGCGRAAVWTRANGLQALIQPPGFACATTGAISGDGRVIGGSTPAAPGTMPQPAALWLPSGQWVTIGDLPGGPFSASVESLSFDGSVAVGEGRTEAGLEGWVWTAATGLVNIGDLPGGSVWCIPFAVSDDGELVAGVGNTDAGNMGWRWTAATGMIPLGTIPPGTGSRPSVISGDGRTIMGTITNAGGFNMFPFAWTSEGGMRTVPYPAGGSSATCTATTTDGSIIAGEVKLTRPPRGQFLYAYLWDRVRGTRVLEDVLRDEMGVDLGGYVTAQISGISDDGTVIVGWCHHETSPANNFTASYSFVARLPPTCWADMDQSGGVDGADAEVFFIAWQDGLPEGDFDHSGGVDGSDVAAFFEAWERGC